MFTLNDLMKARAVAKALVLTRQEAAEEVGVSQEHEYVEFYTQGVLDMLQMLKKMNFEGTSADVWDRIFENEGKQEK